MKDLTVYINKEGIICYVNGEVPQHPSEYLPGEELSPIPSPYGYNHLKEYQSALQACKDSSVPFEDQNAIAVLLYKQYRRGDIYEQAQWNIKPDTFYSLSVQGEVEIGAHECKEKQCACRSHDLCRMNKRFARIILNEPAPVGAVSEGLCITDSKVEESQEEFLLHLIDVTACFVMEQNMYLATSTRKELISKARETYGSGRNKAV